MWKCNKDAVTAYPSLALITQNVLVMYMRAVVALPHIQHRMSHNVVASLVGIVAP